MSYKDSNEYRKSIKALDKIIDRERDIFNVKPDTLESTKKAIVLLREWLVEAFEDDSFREHNELDSTMSNIFIEKSESDTQDSE